MLVWLIRIFHFLIMLYFVLTPFTTNNKELLRNYVVFALFLMFHWLTNNDTCALTLIEGYLTDQDEAETFTGKIIKPIYQISSVEIYIILCLLILWSSYKYLTS